MNKNSKQQTNKLNSFRSAWFALLPVRERRRNRYWDVTVFYLIVKRDKSN